MTGTVIELPDPIVVLKAKWVALDAQCQLASDYGVSGEADAISLRCVEIEDRIAELVPRSAGGAAVQVWLLQHLAADFEWGEGHNQIVANLISGLERIGKSRA